MQFTGIIKNKARVLPKVVYLDVVEKVGGPHKQWVLFRPNHTMQDINEVANAKPGSSIIVDGKDNLNKKTNLSQVVVNKVINIIPEDGDLSNTTMPDAPQSAQDIMDLLLDPLGLNDQMAAEGEIITLVNDFAKKHTKQNATLLLCRLIASLAVGK